MSSVRKSCTTDHRKRMGQIDRVTKIEKPFRCTECDLRFTTNAARNIHAKSHKTSEVFVCKECQFRTKDYLTFRKHRLDECTLQRHQCQKCERTFITTVELKEHMLKAHSRKQYQCKQCNFKTYSAQGLVRHRTCKHPSENEHIDFACAECDFTCRTKDQIKKHIEEEHTLGNADSYPCDDPGNDVFTCPLCDYLDPDSHNMEMHIQEVHDFNTSKPFSCTECDHEFYDDVELELHIMSEHGEIACSQCEYTGSAKELKIHMKMHNTLAKSSDCFSCTLCDFTATANVDLENHIFEVHTKDVENTKAVSQLNSESNVNISQSGKKLKPKNCFEEYDNVPDRSNRVSTDNVAKDMVRDERKRQCIINKDHLYKRQGIDCKCPICGEYFVSKHGLSIHMNRRHDVHKCEDCNTTFKTGAGLKNHMDNVHSLTQIFSCPKCDYKCSTEMDLRRHISVHEPKRQFSCPECEDSYDDKAELVTHMLSMNHTGGKPYSCTKCKGQFLTLVGLNIHMESHGPDTPYKDDRLEDSDAYIADKNVCSTEIVDERKKERNMVYIPVEALSSLTELDYIDNRVINRKRNRKLNPKYANEEFESPIKKSSIYRENSETIHGSHTTYIEDPLENPKHYIPEKNVCDTGNVHDPDDIDNRIINRKRSRKLNPKYANEEFESPFKKSTIYRENNDTTTHSSDTAFRDDTLENPEHYMPEKNICGTKIVDDSDYTDNREVTRMRKRKLNPKYTSEEFDSAIKESNIYRKNHETTESLMLSKDASLDNLDCVNDSENVGDPENVGEPENIGEPENVGDPENIGDPENVGDSENIGDSKKLGDPKNVGDPDYADDPDSLNINEAMVVLEPVGERGDSSNQIENNIVESGVEDEHQSYKENTVHEVSIGQIEEYAEEDDDDSDFGVEGDYIEDYISEDEECENIQTETNETATTTLNQENIKEGKEIENVVSNLVKDIEDKYKEIINADNDQEVESTKNNNKVKNVEPFWIVEKNNTVSKVTSLNPGTNVEDILLKENFERSWEPVSPRRVINEYSVKTPDKRKADESLEGHSIKNAMKVIQYDEDSSIPDESIVDTEKTFDFGDDMQILYGCSECDYVGPKRGLQIHAKKHSNIKQFTCEKCEYACYSINELKTHKTKHHLGQNFFACAECDFISPSANGIKIHVRTHTENEYLCDQCDYKCLSIETLQKHYNNHKGLVKLKLSKQINKTRSRKLNPKYVSEEFDSAIKESNIYRENNKTTEVLILSKERLRRKIVAIPYMADIPKSENSPSFTEQNHETEGSDSSNDENITSASKGDETNTKKGKGKIVTMPMVQNVITLEGSNESKAVSSGEGENTAPFASVGRKGNPMYQCKYCQFMSISRRGLSVHMKGLHGVTNEPQPYPKGTWVGTRQYVCELCDYKAPTSAQLVVHFRTHTGDRPWSCLECGARFTQKSSMKIHEACHLEEKPFACKYEGCNYGTSLKLNLNQHYYKHRFDENKNKRKIL